MAEVVCKQVSVCILCLRFTLSSPSVSIVLSDSKSHIKHYTIWEHGVHFLPGFPNVTGRFSHSVVSQDWLQ